MGWDCGQAPEDTVSDVLETTKANGRDEDDVMLLPSIVSFRFVRILSLNIFLSYLLTYLLHRTVAV